MILRIAAFELRYQTRQAVFLVAAALLALLAFGAVTSDAVVIGGSIGSVNRNAPYVIQQFLLVLSVIGVFATTAFVATAVQRDFEHGTHEIFLSLPVRRRDYLLGRFGGALAASLLLFVLVAGAIALGGFMPWLDPARVGPFAVGPYLAALGLLVLPNLFLTGALFFSVASFTRSLLWTYAAVVALFTGYFTGLSFLRDLESQKLAALLDPFGFAAFDLATRYWTVVEKNSRLLPLAGPLLTNRLAWCALGALVLLATVARFDPAAVGARRRRAAGPAAPAAMPLRPPAMARPVARPTGSRHAALAQLAAQARLETRLMLRSAPFLVLLGLGVLNILGNARGLDRLYGTPVWPESHLMVQAIESAFALFALLVMMFYSGELTWRDRHLRIDGVIDASPVPTPVLWGAKLLTLAAGLATLLTASLLTAIGFQLWHGFHRIEPEVYGQGLFLLLGGHLLLVAILALFLQAVADNKWLGYLLVVAYYVAISVLPQLHFQHHLYLYATTPEAPWSQMNGYRPFLQPLLWFGLYWLLGGAILVVLTHLLWPRGAETSLRLRLAEAGRRLGRRERVLLGALGLGMALTGGWIFYNTNVRNLYLPSDHRLDLQAAYEKKYKAEADLPGPRIVAARASVDIHPEQRAAEIRGLYRLRNPGPAALDRLRVSLNPDLRVASLKAGGQDLRLDDPEQGHGTLALATPLAPGGEIDLEFNLRVENPGFVNHGADTRLVGNGSFLDSWTYFPHLGYDRSREIDDPNERRRRGLPPIQRMPALEDPAARGRNYAGSDADWLDFETTVSTSADQVAIAPGNLEREWSEGGRRYFHYRLGVPMLGFWSYLSGRWQIRRDRWGEVGIEVYYHPDHPDNVDRMIDAVKKSLDYYSANFSPYQHHQVRIVEFPRYARFAQAFAGTIPFSEAIGFVARLEDPDAVDYAFYVTAHEVAHQWWAHQLIGADCQGSTVLSETLSQYSALMVMEKEYGPSKMRRFLKYELERYLRGRGGERIEELPLLRVENQPYIHYNKGSLAMYALRDAIGEAAVNRALSHLLGKHAHQGPPYPTSLDLLQALAGQTPPEHRGLLHDLFESITLWDQRLQQASAVRRPDGRWTVTVEAELRKLRATGSGIETGVALDEWVDVGVFGRREPGSPPEGRVLALEKRRVRESPARFELVVDGEPVKAGIDPLNKLIDRNPEDNLGRVERSGGS